MTFKLLLALMLISSTGIAQTKLGKNICCILQDSKGNYWFSSEGDGLSNNQIRIIQEDLLFGTQGDGVCKFNGFSFYKASF